jgi:hypothetical protein
MTATEDLNSYDTAKAELWYTQAYSLVDYLLNHRSRDEFYKLCTELKNKTPLHQALYRTYGMPFNKVSVLQNVWLHDLQKAYQNGRLDSLTPTAAAPSKPVAPAATKANSSTPQPKAASQPKTQIKQLQMVPQNQLPG